MDSRHDDASHRAWADPHRPRFHLVPPAGWLNDPNGFGRWQGRCHLFFQYNPDAPVHGRIHWGHVSSTDLLHWTDEPVALTPSPGPDQDGCWSGVLVDDNGTPTLVYTGHHAEEGDRVCLARGSADLRAWSKDPANPVLDRPEVPGLTEFRDHCVWREDGEWRQLVSAGLRDRGGAALLFRSEDLKDWDYLGPLVVGDATVTEPVWTGSAWECVDLVRFEAEGPAYPDVLVFSAWDQGTTMLSACTTGRYDGATFTPATTALLDHGLRYFYAPQTFRDDDGRRVMVGWIQEGRGAEALAEAGWAGVMSLPRELSLDADGAVVQWPAAEVAALRSERHDLPVGVQVAAGVQLDVEVDVVVPPGGMCVLGLRESAASVEERADEPTPLVEERAQRASRNQPDSRADPTERTRIELRGDAGETAVRLLLDRSAASLDPDVDATPRSGLVPVGPDRRVRLRVLVDRSAVEVFANGQALTTRVYPTRADAHGLSLSVGGGAEVGSAAWWPMASVWHGPRPVRP